ncbi:protein-L-isoaspartate O-methyltransferase [Sphingomonas daechungensis]|uniref:protein-L-isoaspartate O-methyltransferase n=1 Tax=Sphingomonas daechungensis TaxID=1176646 RepID=UPI003783C6B0
MTAHAPVPDYAAARQAMVDSQLRPQGVNDPSVIEAMSVVPREKFVPDELKPLAYIDRSIPLGEGRALTSSAVLGLLLTALTPLRGERALIVGAATGYSAAVMAELGLEVVALESSRELAAIARKNRAKPVEGSLQDGYPAKAPYDLILIDQLVDGGRLGGAIVDKGITRLFVGRKVGGGFGQISIADMATPALPGFERPRVFTF